jgi:hypothetical protein
MFPLLVLMVVLSFAFPVVPVLWHDATTNISTTAAEEIFMILFFHSSILHFIWHQRSILFYVSIGGISHTAATPVSYTLVLSLAALLSVVPVLFDELLQAAANITARAMDTICFIYCHYNLK